MKKRLPTISERSTMRERPKGTPVMHQSWDKLLFMHWEYPVEVLRQAIPKPLEIDTFDGKAWIAITPLTIWDARPHYLPAVPSISEMHELNVRTYVHLDGVPGVWFFSLDANNLVAVGGARTLFSLPYFHAEITLEQEDDTISFSLRRTISTAKFNAKWTIGDELPEAEPGTLDFFLIERYCLYTASGDAIYRCRINHEPWPLQEAAGLSDFDSTMIEADGLPAPEGEPLLHCGGPVHVDVWSLEEAA